MFGDKYHGGVPADRFRPSRMPVGPQEPPPIRRRNKLFLFASRPFVALWMLVNRMGLWKIRNAMARRAILRSIELRGPRRVGTVRLLMEGLRGGPGGLPMYDHLETANLMAMARACGATMMGSWDLTG